MKYIKLRLKAVTAITSVLAFSVGCTPMATGSGNLPPATSINLPLNNSSFVADQHGRLTGWGAVEHAQGNSYTFVADTAQIYSPPSSLRIRRHGKEDFGLVRQVIKIPENLHGKSISVHLHGYLRAEAVSDAGGALMLQARRTDNSISAYSDMTQMRVTGSRDWRPYSVELKLPPDAYDLIVGVMLEGGGTLWADDLTLTLVTQ